ncbi:MAG: hypothetical protein ACR2O4_05750 [Hyphomicrobiaceae bacterium]
MLRLLGRLLLIPIAFVLAALAAFAVIMLLGYEQIAEASAVGTDDAETMIEGWINMFGEARILWTYLSAATILPGIVLVLVGEAASIRSAVFYVLGAGIALAAMPVIHDLSTANQISGTVMDVWPKFATAGFAGGLVYWLLAGRTA